MKVSGAHVPLGPTVDTPLPDDPHNPKKYPIDLYMWIAPTSFNAGLLKV